MPPRPMTDFGSSGNITPVVTCPPNVRIPMELRRFRYFVAVAEELHFRRAAERLHLAQPALSQQVRKLEMELGVELLHRTKRGVALTTAGMAFLPEARRLLRQADEAARTAQGVREGGR